MLLSPRRRSTTADLLRLLAVWLAAIVLVQGLAAARALGAGPLHHHRNDAAMQGVATAAHHHHHADDAHHHHAAGDASVVPVASVDDAFDAAAFALTAAMLLMALSLWPLAMTASRGHAWKTTPGWAWCTASPAARKRPPRPC